jgi:hypothetical protein
VWEGEKKICPYTKLEKYKEPLKETKAQARNAG